MSVSRNFTAGRLCRAALCALLVLGRAPACADPADYVFTPYADAGLWQLAYGMGSERDRDGARARQQTLGLGGSPTARWYTSAYAAWAASGGGTFAVDEWSWLNHLALTTPGAGPVDVGLLCELARPHDRDEGRLGVSCGPTLQMDTDALQVNVNLSLGKHFGTDEATSWQLGYQWQAKTLVARGFELGAQGFGSTGPWNHWAAGSAQRHTLGPAIFWKTATLGAPVRVDAAWLFGIGDGSAKDVLRLRLQYEF